MRIFLSKIIDWLIIAFLFLLPWQVRWIWQPGEINGAPWEYGTYSFYGTEILLWLIIILFVINKFRHKEFWKKIISSAHYQTHKKYLFFALGFVIFLVASVLHSKNVWLSYNYIFYLLGALCLFVIVSEMGDFHLSFPRGTSGESCVIDPGSRSGMTDGRFKMTVALWLGGVVQGLLALWQFLTQFVYGNKWLGMATQDPNNLGAAVIEFGDERWLRAYGSFGWPNSLGIYLSVCLIIGVILYLSFRARPRNPLKILVSLGQVIITVGLVLSFSRSAWLAAVVGLAGLFYFVLSSRLKPVRQAQGRLRGMEGSLKVSERDPSTSLGVTSLFKQISFIIIPIVCLFFIFQPIFLARFNPQNRLENRSLSERQGQYTEFKQIFLSHPWLGVGPGAYTLALSETYSQAKAYDLQPVHNIYLLTLAEWGIIGSLIWFFIFGFLGWHIWKDNKIFVPVILVLLMAGFFDHWNYTLYTGLVLWWVIWGIGLTGQKKPN